jgi:hypothetical protein
MFHDYAMYFLFAFVGLAVSVAFIALTTQNRYVQRQAPPNDEVDMRADPKKNSDRFYAFLKLAKWAYATRIPDDKIEEFRCHGASGSYYEFSFISKRGPISIWRCTKIPSWENTKYLNAYVIALPGTDVLQDIAIDINLALGKSEEYNKEVQELRKDVTDFLKTALPNVDTYRLIICGHSKAASLGESLHQTFQRDKKFISHSAITYDSPGQPSDYRRTWREEDKKEIYTLNAVPNFINTLNPPCAKNLWSCGEGSAIKLDVLYSVSSILLCFLKGSYLMTLQKPTSFILKQMSRCFLKEAKNNLNTHSLDHMEQFLKTNDITFEHSSRWPLYSGCAVQFLGDAVNVVCSPFSAVKIGFRTICTSFIGRDTKIGAEDKPSVAETLPDLEEDVPLLFEEEDTQQRHNLPSLPIDIATMVPRIVYEAKFENGRCPFFDQLTDDDAIIPIIGLTGSGKTTLMSRLSKQSIGDFPIYNGSNNSIFPLVMIWKTHEDGGITRRIYLVDLPGIGAPKQAKDDIGHSAKDHVFHGTFKCLFELTLKYSSAVLFIHRDVAAVDEVRAILEEVREETSKTNTALLVGLNTDSDFSDCDFDTYDKQWKKDAELSLKFVLEKSFRYPKPLSTCSTTITCESSRIELAKHRFAERNRPSLKVVQRQLEFRDKLCLYDVVPFCAKPPSDACPDHLYPVENLIFELDNFYQKNASSFNKRAVERNNIQGQLTDLHNRLEEVSDVKYQKRSWSEFVLGITAGGINYIN